MTLEQLIEMGLTKEQAEKVMDSLDGNFVTKTRFNEVNTELKLAKETITERDTQLKTLNDSVGDVEALKKQITDLQEFNKMSEETHANELKELKFSTALNSALSSAKAKNPETVKPLLKTFLEKAMLTEDGSINGLNEEIKKLVDNADTKFLFEVKHEQKPGFKGWIPAEKKDGNPTPLTFEESIKAHYEAQN